MKSHLERALVRSGFLRLAGRRVRGRTLVLAYHNVTPEKVAPCGDASLHLGADTFRRHLDVIQGVAEVVDLTRVSHGAPDRPHVSITFDDAYRGAIRHALPELARRGIPATIFVPPAFVPSRPFWWDDLGRSGGLSAADRAVALHESRGRDVEVRRSFAQRLAALAAAPEDLQCASLEELQSAVTAGPVTLGSHTWSHPNLARATTAELADELARPLTWLHQHFPAHSLPAISYPYGLRSTAVEFAAREAGYTMGFLVDGGWLPPRPANFLALPRLNVPAGLSADGLALRLSGLFA